MIFVSTLSVNEHKDAISTVEKMIANGIRNIELGANHEFFENTNKIIELKKEHGLEYTQHAFFPPVKKAFIVNIGSANEEILKDSLDVARSCIEFGRKIESNLYSIHTPYLSDVDLRARPISESTDMENCVKIMKTSLAELSDYANNYGMKLALENQSGLNETGKFFQPSLIRDIIKSTGLKNVGLLIDIGHLNVSSKLFGFDKKEEIEKVKDMIFELHIHENDGLKDSHRPLTSGRMLDCFSKEILKDKILTIEGYQWNFEEIENSKKIVSELIQ